MCDICRQSPCNPRCPNAPDPPTIYTCKHCGEPIVEGDEYVDVDGDFYHAECFSEAAESILMEQVWVTKGVAEVER